jgi:D-alanyl-D-alanine carboxypeptidase/D-alanyl-D-alanine-endopeptidase (penicillin-binding protein 4)
MEPPMIDFVIEPPRLDNQACTSWKEKLDTALEEKRVFFAGSYSVNCGERVLILHAQAISHVTYFDAVFRQLWRELGGSITGMTLEGKKTDDARELLQWESLTLAQIIRDINKYSNNVMARQLLISLSREPTGTTLTTQGGAARAQSWLATIGVNTQPVVIENGSGLSRHERLSAESISAVLHHEWKSPLMPEFIASLPIVGIDGTMSRSFTNSAATMQGHIKTGSLNEVASMAGYVKAKSGRWISVVCMINHPEANKNRAMFNQLLEWIVERY